MALRRPVMRLLRLHGFPILQQLQLEERLLRTTPDNWCLLNDGTAPPAIVMGISGYVLGSVPQSVFALITFQGLVVNHRKVVSYRYTSRLICWELAAH